MLTRRQARKRKKIIVSVITVMCLMLATVAYRIADVMVSEWLGINAYHAADYAGSAELFDRNTVLNPAQRWIAFFDRGVAHQRAGRWADAETDYRTALPLTPPSHRCIVALNLAWTLESKGDGLRRVSTPNETQASWHQAQELLRSEKCPDTVPPKTPGKPNPAGSLADQQKATSDRLAQKSQQLQDQQSNSKPEQDGQPSDEQKAEELQQREQQAAKAAQEKKDTKKERAPVKQEESSDGERHDDEKANW